MPILEHPPQVRGQLVHYKEHRFTKKQVLLAKDAPIDGAGQARSSEGLEAIGDAAHHAGLPRARDRLVAAQPRPEEACRRDAELRSGHRVAAASNVNLPLSPATIRQNDARLEVDLGAVGQSPDLCSTASMHGIRVDVQPADLAQGPYAERVEISCTRWGAPQRAEAQPFCLAPVGGGPCSQMVILHDRSNDREAMEAPQEDGQVVRIRSGHGLDGAAA